MATWCSQNTARDAMHISGRRGITQTEMGSLIEDYHRTVTFNVILGGDKLSMPPIPLSSSGFANAIYLQHMTC
ncbi:hypothetical protein V8E52_007696 [Russula decolorans]